VADGTNSIAPSGLAAGVFTAYTWDQRNRLTGIADYDGPND